MYLKNINNNEVWNTLSMRMTMNGMILQTESMLTPGHMNKTRAGVELWSENLRQLPSEVTHVGGGS